jgi:hypothetical protein
VFEFRSRQGRLSASDLKATGQKFMKFGVLLQPFNELSVGAGRIDTYFQRTLNFHALLAPTTKYFSQEIMLQTKGVEINVDTLCAPHYSTAILTIFEIINHLKPSGHFCVNLILLQIIQTMYVCRNNVTRSYKNCCSGKALRILGVCL